MIARFEERERERERDCASFLTRVWRATEAASDTELAVAKRDLKSVAVVVLSSVEVEGDEEGSVWLWNPYMWLKSGFHIHGASWIPFARKLVGIAMPMTVWQVRGVRMSRAGSR